jgi:hypothetical protein
MYIGYFIVVPGCRAHVGMVLPFRPRMYLDLITSQPLVIHSFQENTSSQLDDENNYLPIYAPPNELI